MFYYDPTMILVIPAMIFALIAQGMVNSAFSRYSKVRARSGMTGEQVARALAHSNGLNVTVHEVKGTLSDHYDPVKKTINLSPEYTGALRLQRFPWRPTKRAMLYRTRPDTDF